MERRVDLRKVLDLSKLKFLDLRKLLKSTKDKKDWKAISKHMGDRHTLYAGMLEKPKRKRRNRRRNKIASQSRRVNRK